MIRKLVGANLSSVLAFHQVMHDKQVVYKTVKHSGAYLFVQAQLGTTDSESGHC